MTKSMSRFKTIKFKDSDYIYVVDTVDDTDMGSFISQRCANEFTQICENADDIERLKQFRRTEKENYKKPSESGSERFSYEWNIEEDEGWLKDAMYDNLSVGPYKDEWELQQLVNKYRLMSVVELVLYDKKMMNVLLPKYDKNQNSD